jgi:hypothetical protein
MDGQLLGLLWHYITFPFRILYLLFLPKEKLQRKSQELDRKIESLSRELEELKKQPQ